VIRTFQTQARCILKADGSDDLKTRWIKFGTTTGVAIVALVVGLVQFGTINSFSVRQPFLEKQTELCHLAAEHSARLASTIDAQTWQKSREEFWMLYWGPLAIVEDVESQRVNRVETAMVEFKNELTKINPVAPTLPINSLQLPALNVAHACRDLLSSKWNFGILRWFGHE
jgi:hypothetical protein